MNLRRLALAAREDDTALVVFADAVQIAGWADRRVGRLLNPTLSADDARAMHRQLTAAPTREWARACAAVLLFGGWTKGWYAWGWRNPADALTRERIHQAVRALWGADRIREQLYSPSPILGMIARREKST